MSNKVAGRRWEKYRDNATGSGHVEYEIPAGDPSGAFQQANKSRVSRKFKLGTIHLHGGLLRYWLLPRN